MKLTLVAVFDFQHEAYTGGKKVFNIQVFY